MAKMDTNRPTGYSSAPHELSPARNEMGRQDTAYTICGPGNQEVFTAASKQLEKTRPHQSVHIQSLQDALFLPCDIVLDLLLTLKRHSEALLLLV